MLIYPAASDCATIAGLQVPPEHASAHTSALWGSVCLVAGLGIATALVDEQRRRREAREQQEALDALFGGTDLLDDEDDDDDANRLNLGLPFRMDAEGGDSDAPFVRHDALTPAAFQTGCERVFLQEDVPWRGVVGNRLAGTPSARAVDIACPKATIRSVPSREPVSPMHQTPVTRKSTPSPAKPHGPRSGLWAAVAGLLVLLGGGLIFHGSPFGSQPPTPAATCPAGNLTATYVTGNAGERHLPAQRIDTIQVGQRLVGRNPIREQAELVEPDPATWRKISLYMTKESGLGLWIDLLRPLSWIDERGAMVGGSIYFEMPDMGAVGDAQVTYIGPCPPIEPGDGGAVVTGTFKHQADASNKVIHLQLEDQSEPTGVTDNHPYWSVDRREFVPVGQLRVGELVDTVFGLKHVASITPIDHNGFLYNLETTEHVYRVGSLGTLVHNTCPMPIPKAGRQIRQTVRARGMKVDRLFANRNDAMNWAARQLGPTKQRIYNAKGQWIGWRNAVNDSVYWYHADWRIGPGTSRFPHLNYQVGPNSGHLFLGDKIFNTGLWLDFSRVFGL